MTGPGFTLTTEQVCPATPQGDRVPVMAETIRCPLSDMPPEWCAHCRGDNPAVSGDSFVAVPLSLRAFRPRYITPLDTPPPVSVLPPLWRDVVTHAYPLLCARGELCRASEHGGPRQTGQRAWLCPPCEDHTRDDLLAAGLPIAQEAMTCDELANELSRVYSQTNG